MRGNAWKCVEKMQGNAGECVEMTEEQIKQRIEMLKAQLEQLKANSNAILGALQDCEYWLQQINAAKKEE
jgi:prefoldin subunit 5